VLLGWSGRYGHLREVTRERGQVLAWAAGGPDRLKKHHPAVSQHYVRLTLD